MAKASLDDSIREVGFPGIPEDQIVETSPTTSELGKDKKDDDNFFERTDFEYKTQFKVYNGSNDVQAQEYAELTDKFLNAKKPKKVGDPPCYIRLKEESAFTKDGDYMIAIKWTVCTAKAVKDTQFDEVKKDESEQASV